MSVCVCVQACVCACVRAHFWKIVKMEMKGPNIRSWNNEFIQKKR